MAERITGTTTLQTSNSGVSNLFDANFYVLNSSRNVYKCLDNNNNGASTSRTDRHKHNCQLYQLLMVISGNICIHVSASEQSNFLSTDFMAVSTNRCFIKRS